MLYIPTLLLLKKKMMMMMRIGVCYFSVRTAPASTSKLLMMMG